jgi:hypothetical protein
MPETPGDDPLDTLRAHVRSAQAAAERLVREVGQQPAGGAAAKPPPATIAGGERTPPSGWHADEPERAAGGELQALAELVDSLRALLPPELREQLNEVIRQLLLLLRAVIDWLVARIEHDGRGREIQVEDIPIT